MAEYGGTLLCVCLLGAVVRMLSPEGDMKRYVGLVASFCALLAIAAPLLTQMEDGGLRGFWERWEEWEDAETVNYDEIYDKCPDKNTLISKLADMYVETIEALFNEPEGTEGNAKWTASW